MLFIQLTKFGEMFPNMWKTDTILSAGGARIKEKYSKSTSELT